MSKAKNDSPIKKMLAEALKKRLENTVLEKITIRELTDDCGVNRQTFYYHFEDIYDLLRWLFHEEISTTLDLEDLSIPWQDNFRGLLSYLNENRDFCISVLNSVEHRVLRRFLSEFMSDITRRALTSGRIRNSDTMLSNMDEETIEFRINLYARGIASLIESRLLDEIKLSDEDFLRKMEQLVSG